MTKICSKCKQEKDLSSFSNNRAQKDGKHNQCKECLSEYNKKKHEDSYKYKFEFNGNKKKLESHIILWMKVNNLKFCASCVSYLSVNKFHKGQSLCKECKKIKDHVYWEENKERQSKKHKEWIEKNNDHYLDYHKNYRTNNKDKIKSYCQSENGRNTRNSYNRKWSKYKRDNDPFYRINHSMRTGILSDIGKNKNRFSWRKFVPYSLDQLINRLESTLPRGYTLENYKDNKFHIDHIVPLNYFNHTSFTDLDFKLAWRLKNLRLLKSKENIGKSDRIDFDYQKELLEEISFYRQFPSMYTYIWEIHHSNRLNT